jgi:hypothetical protein
MVFRHCLTTKKIGHGSKEPVQFTLRVKGTPRSEVALQPFTFHAGVVVDLEQASPTAGIKNFGPYDLGAIVYRRLPSAG